MVEWIISYGIWGLLGVFAAGFACGILGLWFIASEVFAEIIGEALW